MGCKTTKERDQSSPKNPGIQDVFPPDFQVCPFGNTLYLKNSGSDAVLYELPKLRALYSVDFQQKEKGVRAIAPPVSTDQIGIFTGANQLEIINRQGLSTHDLPFESAEIEAAAISPDASYLASMRWKAEFEDHLLLEIRDIKAGCKEIAKIEVPVHSTISIQPGKDFRNFVVHGSTTFPKSYFVGVYQWIEETGQLKKIYSEGPAEKGVSQPLVLDHRFFVDTGTGIQVFNQGKIVHKIPGTHPEHIRFSPSGDQLLLWRRETAENSDLTSYYFRLVNVNNFEIEKTFQTQSDRQYMETFVLDEKGKLYRLWISSQDHSPQIEKFPWK